MNLSTNPSSLRLPLLALAISILVCGFALFVGFRIAEQYDAEARDASDKLVDYRQNISHANSSIEKYRRNLPDYEKLIAQHVVGDEPRLQWTELIRNKAEKVGIPSLLFDLQKRIPFVDSDTPEKYRGLALFKSRMTLNMELRHEAQLLDLLALLRNSGQGYFLVNACAMQPIGIKQQGDNIDWRWANIQARCEIDWITINFDAVREPSSMAADQMQMEP